MHISEIIYLFHWVIYILSFVAFGTLFTKHYKWGAVYIGILFLIQTIFHGCPVIDIQNYFRLKEGLLPIENGLLTDRFSSNIGIQSLISGIVSFMAFSLLLF